ncbi:MAG: iron ABC transporter permease [Candidatus Methanomethylophilaceae archaeon]|nr:iron ABC transporter permease [Candidatus Methanomethylophilaceae archaeon]
MNQGLSAGSAELISEYHKLVAKKIALFVICVLGVVLFVGFFSLSVYPGIDLVDTYKILWGHITGQEFEKRSLYWWADIYIWNSAIPHALVAIIAGSSLAICGTLMQALMNNPLADPYSTGISSGACFGAVAAIVMGVSFATVGGEMGVVVNAFIGALVPALIIIIISTRIHATPATLILLGTAISYFFNSMITYMMVTTDSDTLKSAYLWQVGSLDGMTWDSVPLMLIVTVVGCIFVMFASNKLNVMALGEKSATSLGVDVYQFRIICLALMALMTAAIVSFTGILGFVGLVAPHIIRLLIGSDNRFVLPISMAVGSLFMLVADYLASVLMTIPVGVILSLVGSPIFFLLIVVQSKRAGAIY